MQSVGADAMAACSLRCLWCGEAELGRMHGAYCGRAKAAFHVQEAGHTLLPNLSGCIHCSHSGSSARYKSICCL